MSKRPPYLCVWLMLSAVALFAGPLAFALPPVAVPAENPITEPKRILGKILFWDEQLSSDNTVACGSCHQPRFGGADGRRAHGADGVFGSPGIRHLDSNGQPVDDKVFGKGAQVGTRAAPSVFGALWSESLFWDGRAGGRFLDPISERVAIRRGGALESQAVQPIMNPVEMAREGREWQQVIHALQRAQPLALARKLPPDVKAAISRDSSYPSLFKAAFGDPGITPVRIAFAIATYERTLVAARTPWDDWVERGRAPSSEAAAGSAAFHYYRCDECHVPPLFTNNQFAKIGLRAVSPDPGRRSVTGVIEDDGRIKVPSLRNVGLRVSLTHTGALTTLDQILDLYGTPEGPRDKLPDGSEYSPQVSSGDRAALKDFLLNLLTDPRVAQELAPFDRPQLRSERAQPNERVPYAPVSVRAECMPDGRIRITWAPSAGPPADDYMIQRGAVVVAFVTRPELIDDGPVIWPLYHYRISARNAAALASAAVSIWAVSPSVWWWLMGMACLIAVGGAGVWHRRSVSARDTRRHARPN